MPTNLKPKPAAADAADDVDVAPFVDAHARATAGVKYGVIAKTNPLPKAAAPVMTLKPPQQARAVVLLMRRVAAARDPKVKNRVWWNYLASAAPTAGSVTLIHALLRKKLPFSADDLAELLDHVLAVRGTWGYALGEPTAGVVKAVEHRLAGAAPGEPLRARLTKLERRLEAAGPEKATKKTLRGLLGL